MSDIDYRQLWQEEYGPQSLDKELGLNKAMSDDHPNPMFRPTVQKLYQKLWGMKILHDQDNRVHILSRLAVELDPPHLAELIHGLQGRLYFKLGYIDAAQHRDWPILHFGDAQWPWQWGPEPPLNLDQLDAEMEEEARTPGTLAYAAAHDGWREDQSAEPPEDGE